ncbi:MAG TPA: porin [Allosphingosinicella sp.]|nr:porin [Allosphingosinicella sp.]
MAGLGGASLIALALVLTPALAAPNKKGESRSAPSLIGRGVSSFTPAVADARLAAAFARREFRSGSFRFTPATASLDKSKAVRVAVRARSGAATQVASRAGSAGGAGGVASAESAPAAITAVTPTAYNLGVSVGWKRFALSGDVGRVENGVVTGERKSAELGVGYSGKKAGAKVRVAAERAEGNQRLVGVDSTYSVDVGASYSIARNIDVTGGVRYKVQQDRLEPLTDARRDSQAVYIGTAFRF